MGKSSRFRISRVIPHAWFYKLRGMGRSTNKRLHSASKLGTAECPISLPSSNYYKYHASSQRFGQVYASSPLNHMSVDPDIRFGHEPTKPREEIRNGSTKKLKAKKRIAGRPNSVFIDSRISAGCSCRATVGSIKGDQSSDMNVFQGRRRSNSSKKHSVHNKNTHDIMKPDKVENQFSCHDFDLQQSRMEKLQIGDENSRPRVYKAKKPTAPHNTDQRLPEDSYAGNSLSMEAHKVQGTLEKQTSGIVQNPFVKRNHNSSAMKCSAFCCNCRLSISSIEGEKDGDKSLWDMNFWSEDDDTGHENLQMPFLQTKLSHYNRLVLDMKFKFSPVDDWKESAATLFRRREAVSHAQVQAKLSQMIQAKGAANSIHTKAAVTSDDDDDLILHEKAWRNSQVSGYFSENETDFRKFKEYGGPAITAFPYESDPETTASEDCNSVTPPVYNNNNASEIQAARSVEPPALNGREMELLQRKSESSHSQSSTRMLSSHSNGKIPKSKNRAKIDDRQKGGQLDRVSTERKAKLKQKTKNSGSISKDTVSDAQRKISESFAIVKCSYDPHKDFRESMVEMIVENDIHHFQDLQELLHCYISLNSEEYHHVIFEAFEQVRSDFFDLIV
eukprot:Gb_24942 [translate_table: standard]